MVRKYGVMSPREIEQCHKGLMGGMSDSDRERVTRSAEARARIDYWSSQLERERDVVALISNRQNADNYVPDHAARRDRWQLRKALELSLGEDPVRVCGEVCGQHDAAPAAPADRVIIDLTQD